MARVQLLVNTGQRIVISFTDKSKIRHVFPACYFQFSYNFDLCLSGWKNYDEDWLHRKSCRVGVFLLLFLGDGKTSKRHVHYCTGNVQYATNTPASISVNIIPSLGLTNTYWVVSRTKITRTGELHSNVPLKNDVKISVTLRQTWVCSTALNFRRGIILAHTCRTRV